MRTRENQLISGVMVADGNGPALGQAARYFVRQSHPEKELIVVHGGDASQLTHLPRDPHIKIVHAPHAATRAELWLAALANCDGRFLARWDPSDWIGPDRLAAQMSALTLHSATLCAANSLLAYNPHQARAWHCSENLPGLLAGKTWCCDRDRLERSEETSFFTALARQSEEPDRTLPGAHVIYSAAPWYIWVLTGTSVPSLPQPETYIVSAAAGEAIGMLFPDRDYFASLRARYRPRNLRRARPPARPGPRSDAPVSKASLLEQLTPGARSPLPPRARVSCLMPTFNRRRYLPHAIACFLAQDYPDRELVVVDDSDESAEDLVPTHSSIVYIRLRPRRSIGAKRNLAAEAATGDYLMSWDDDDWSGPGRIRHQVAPMLAGRSEVTGMLTGYIFDQRKQQFWRNKSGHSSTLFQQGICWGTLAWARSAQKPGIRFPDSSLAEDVAFKDALARRGARVQCLENPGVYIYVRHGSNSWRFPEEKMLLGDRWEPIAPPDFVPRGTLEFYGHTDLHAFAPPRGATHPARVDNRNPPIRTRLTTLD